MARAALPRRLNWQLAKVVGLVEETAQTTSIVLEPAAWPGHRAGQHVDVRLTAEDGYQAERSYSWWPAALGSSPSWRCCVTARQHSRPPICALGTACQRGSCTRRGDGRMRSTVTSSPAWSRTMRH